MVPPGKYTFFLMWFIFASFFIEVTNSFAALPFNASTTSSSETANYFRLIWGLLVVLGIILVIYGIVRKRFSMFSSSTSQEINILEIRPMMGKKALCLVKVKGQEFLLGISDNNINHIATLPAKTVCSECTDNTEDSFAKNLEAAEGTP